MPAQHDHQRRMQRRDGRRTANGPLTPSLRVELKRGKPPLLRVGAPGDGVRWAAEQRGALRAAVAEHGALLVRGLELGDVTGAEAIIRQLGSPMIEREGLAPRDRLAPGVYSASSWPASQPMHMHHELSYASKVPSLMLFACLVAPAAKGATTVADGSAVLESLPGDLVEHFERAGWLLVRNYGGEFAPSVADAFGTDDRRAVERYCRANAIRFEWQEDGTLRTWQHRSAVVCHPSTRRRCWFNQAAFLSEWTLAPELREHLVETRGEDGLPFATRFGDGEPIGPDVVQAVNEAYDAHTVREEWQAGDLLLVDNIRTAHGREPFDGRREIVVALADEVHRPTHRRPE